MSSSNSAPKKQRWYKQLRETYSFARSEIRGLGLKLFGIFAVVFAALFSVGFFFDQILLMSFTAFTSAALVTLIVFGRWAERAAYKSIEGQLGAAGSVLNALRGAWFVQVGIGVDRNQNIAHRVVGKPGIILVGEGSKPGQLLLEQKRAHARYVPNVPIHELIVGEGQIAIADLQKKIKKLPKSLRPSEVTDVRRRLDALPKTALPIPKGPMPQGRKVPRR
jgi:hypothetical protein